MTFRIKGIKGQFFDPFILFLLKNLKVTVLNALSMDILTLKKNWTKTTKQFCLFFNSVTNNHQRVNVGAAEKLAAPQSDTEPSTCYTNKINTIQCFQWRQK